MLVAARETGVQYEVEHHPAFKGGPALIIRTNADGAEDFKIAWSPLATPGRAYWRDLVAHRPGVYILSFIVLEDWLIRLEREDGLPRIVVRRLESGEEHVIAFAEEAYSLGIEGGYEFATNILRFTYSSMTTPAEVWDYDLASRAAHVCASVRKSPAATTLPITSRDGCSRRPRTARRFRSRSFTARMSPSTRTTPCLLYGYGAYGLSIPAAFSTNRLVACRSRLRLRDRACARRQREGLALVSRRQAARRRRTPSPISSRRASISASSGWCAPGKIVAQGGSAGGTLIGAVGNMRPDLYAGLIAEMPFVDVLNTMLDETLPLTPPEWPEWGDPNRDAGGIADHPGLLALRERARAETIRRSSRWRA